MVFVIAIIFVGFACIGVALSGDLLASRRATVAELTIARNQRAIRRDLRGVGLNHRRNAR